MLLALDIGNTTIAIGVFRAKKILQDWRIKTDKEKTGDEYAIILLNLFQRAGIKPDRIEAVIVSSVVPPLSPVFQGVSRDLFGIEALVVGPGLKTGMPILYENPLEVGADRVVAAIAAYEKYGGPCIVVDFGTRSQKKANTWAGRSRRGSRYPPRPCISRRPGSRGSKSGSRKRPSDGRPWPACSRGFISAISDSCPTRSSRSGRNWGRKPG